MEQSKEIKLIIEECSEIFFHVNSLEKGKQKIDDYLQERYGIEMKTVFEKDQHFQHVLIGDPSKKVIINLFFGLEEIQEYIKGVLA